jgi:hypothetical protein
LLLDSLVSQLIHQCQRQCRFADATHTQNGQQLAAIGDHPRSQEAQLLTTPIKAFHIRRFIQVIHAIGNKLCLFRQSLFNSGQLSIDNLFPLAQAYGLTEGNENIVLNAVTLPKSPQGRSGSVSVLPPAGSTGFRPATLPSCLVNHC